MAFVDKVRVVARAGRGGNGCLSFLREKFREFGGPNGGDGGRGGSVYLLADAGMGTLLDLTYRPHLIAQDGENGKGSDKTGRAAPDLYVRVPVGTVIRREGRLIADLFEAGRACLVARGGRGGRGNLSFKTHANTAPRIYEKGEPGETATLDLELKLIADVGLVGFPNAGKSTLLARLSNARPKIADYPFTTLSPNLGIVQHKESSFVLADIPGLIEGAHRGKGLGDEFLRHIERTRVLVHLIDPMGFGEVEPLKGLLLIEGELKERGRLLAAKPRIGVVNKMDLPEGAEVLARLRRRYPRRTFLGISAATGEGLGPLVDALLALLSRAPRPRVEIEEPQSALRRLSAGFRVERSADGVFRVSGPYVERAAAMTDMSLPEPLERLQRTLRKIGVEKALLRSGVQEGDTVLIGGVELLWAPDVPKRPRRARR